MFPSTAFSWHGDGKLSSISKVCSHIGICTYSALWGKTKLKRRTSVSNRIFRGFYDFVRWLLGCESTRWSDTISSCVRVFARVASMHGVTRTKQSKQINRNEFKLLSIERGWHIYHNSVQGRRVCIFPTQVAKNRKLLVVKSHATKMAIVGEKGKIFWPCH